MSVKKINLSSILFLLLLGSCLTRELKEKRDPFLMDERADKVNLRKEECLAKKYTWYERKRICFCDKEKVIFYDTKTKECLPYK